MSFDPRSRERLEALGRQLPRKLPPPELARPAAPDLPPAEAGRLHPVETEQDPERLFRELMNVSPDGTVPPHLLDRLRQLEAQRRQAPMAVVPAAGQTPSPSGVRKDTTAARRPRPSAPRRPLAGGEHQDLYTAFQQLLLEDEELD
jgi:hypothetical protein